MSTRCWIPVSCCLQLYTTWWTEGLNQPGHSITCERTLLITHRLSFLRSQSAHALSRESGFVLESPTVTAFRNGVLEGKWETVVRLLQDEHIIEGVDVSVGLKNHD